MVFEQWSHPYLLQEMKWHDRQFQFLTDGSPHKVPEEIQDRGCHQCHSPYTKTHWDDRGVPGTICYIGRGVLVVSESSFQVHWGVPEVSKSAVQVAWEVQLVL